MRQIACESPERIVRLSDKTAEAPSLSIDQNRICSVTSHKVEASIVEGVARWR